MSTTSSRVRLCSRCNHGIAPMQLDERSWLPCLRYGVSASQSQYGPLQDELRNLLDHVAELGVEEEKLRERLVAVQTLRRGTEQGIERRSSFLYAPIRRLPNEILAEIFLYVWPRCVGVVKLSHGQPLFPNFLPPASFPIPYVCASWRHLASHTPQLQPWLHLDLVDEGQHPLLAHASGNLEDLPNALLRMRITATHHNWNWQPSMDALARLAEHSKYWRQLELECTSWPALRFIGTTLPLPHLQRAKLVLPKGPLYVGADVVMDWWDEAEQEPNRLNFFEKVPSLRELTLIKQIGKKITTLPFSLPWDRLTSVTVNPLIGADVFVDIVTQCTSLRALTVRDRSGADGGTEWYVSPPRTHKTATFRGETLSVKVGDLRSAEPFLEAITAPAITKLNIGFGATGAERLRALLDFLDRSSCAPTRLTLTLTNGYPSAAEFEELLDHFAGSLRQLRLKLGSSRPFMAFVAGGKAEHALIDALCDLHLVRRLPHLRVLKLATACLYEDTIVRHVLPAFAYARNSPMRELWLATPLDQANWEQTARQPVDAIELYGLSHSFGLRGPAVYMRTGCPRE
ncbi:hypothetical protein HDZ31DRAFT_64849 [Schizophyllum fasciatum]